MGGYYPVAGQLAECARPHFSLVAEVDGSAGYLRANQIRLGRMVRGWLTSPTMVIRIGRALIRHPRVTATMLQSYFIERAWDWQFEGENPPMKLWRQTWERGAE